MTAPLLHTVYMHVSAAGRVLYVGCTKDLKVRTSHHKSGAEAWSPWWPYVATVEVDSLWPDRAKAEQRERQLIVALCPPGNRQHNPRGHYGLNSEFAAIVELLDGDEQRARGLTLSRPSRQVWAELIFADVPDVA